MFFHSIYRYISDASRLVWTGAKPGARTPVTVAKYGCLGWNNSCKMRWHRKCSVQILSVIRPWPHGHTPLTPYGPNPIATDMRFLLILVWYFDISWLAPPTESFSEKKKLNILVGWKAKASRTDKRTPRYVAQINVLLKKIILIFQNTAEPAYIATTFVVDFWL